MSALVEALRARWRALPQGARGIVWAALSGLIFSILNVLMRSISLELHPFVVGFWRYFFGAMAMAPAIVQAGLAAFRAHRPANHVIRSLIHATAFMIWFYALPLIPIAETTALGFTTPLFITLGAVLFLGEQVGIRRWAAVAIGFVGTLIILRPGLSELSLGSILMLASAPMFAASNLLAKAVARVDSVTAIVAWQTTLISLFCLPPALLYWSWPDPVQFLWLALGGGLGTLAHLTLSQSYKNADITAVQPIGFLTLVWVTIMGYLVFGDRPDLWTWIGAAVIFAANTYISHREAVRRGRSDLTGTVPPTPQ